MFVVFLRRCNKFVAVNEPAGSTLSARQLASLFASLMDLLSILSGSAVPSAREGAGANCDV